jgi:pimeloyl-ACP methyl ester carboxylesterase
MRGLLTLIFGLALCVGHSGCVNRVLARKLVQAPNQQTLPEALQKMDVRKKEMNEKYPNYWNDLFNSSPAQTFRIRVGAPPIDIVAVAIEPADHFVEVKRTVTGSPRELKRTEETIWTFAVGHTVRPAKGTIILLHGICMTKEVMLLWALHFGAAGYRTVIVDLRGHGESGGDFITFGERESADLARVLDHLEKKGLVQGKVGVMGISYGAAVGFLWAARDPRVGAVVALEPYSGARRAVGDFMREVVRGPISHLKPATVDALMDQAAKDAGFAWKVVSSYNSVALMSLPILFFHGAHDSLIPLWHSAELMGYAAPGSRLRIMPDDDHESLVFRLDPIGREALSWFDEKLKPETPVAQE